MSFVPNESNQITLDDSVYSLTEREKKFLENSWAKMFAEIIFPNIEEQPFAVLYGDKASRPNTPVNVIIGASILKEMFSLSDDELMESVMFDVRFQYALHTTSMKEQPLSDRTLSRFRKRCLNYETMTGRDLVKESVVSLSEQIGKVMGISNKSKRMDSMMVASNIKKMSRLELLYTCVSNMTKLLAKDTSVADQLKHYLEASDANNVIYHQNNDGIDTRIKSIIVDAEYLLKECEEKYNQSSEYLLLLRVITEQTIKDENGERHLKDKSDKSMDSTILQNPADPDATYRRKAGTQHRGYVANLVESTGEEGSIISGYDYEQNIKSDTDFLKDAVETLGKQDEELTLTSDGAYASEENHDLAKDNNINLVTTNFLGQKPPDCYADFELSEDGQSIIKCANGQEPITSKYYGSKKLCRITMNKDICNSCPLKEQCKPKFHKKKASLEISTSSIFNAKQLRYMKTEDFKELARYRNGVESLPSTLRRKYDVDHMPVRGMLPTKLLFGFKVAALNCKKLFDSLTQREQSAQMPFAA